MKLSETDAEMIAKRLMDAVESGGIGMSLNLLKTELIAGFALVKEPWKKQEEIKPLPEPGTDKFVKEMQEYYRKLMGELQEQAMYPTLFVKPSLEKVTATELRADLALGALPTHDHQLARRVLRDLETI